MKRISEERLDAAIRRLDEEDVAEERRLDAAIRRLDEEEMMEHARQQKKEQEEHARQQKKERENEARQRKEEQEEQAPKARGKYKTFDDRMEDLKRYKETHDHANLPIREDKSLAQFCAKARHARIKSRQGQCEATDQRTHSGL